MAFGYDDAAMMALQLASLGGGFFGKKRKHIDPEMLRQKFGPQAVSKDTIELANFILNSPHGQKLMADAAESGQQFQNSVNANAAQAGLAGPSGSSGTGIFASSAGSQAQSGFERAVKGNVYNAAMPIAAQGVSDRQNAYINDLQGGGYQDDRSRMMEAIGSAAGNAAAVADSYRQGSDKQLAQTANQTAMSAGGTSSAAIPRAVAPVQSQLAPSQQVMQPGTRSSLSAAMTPQMLRKRARQKSMQSIFNRGYVQPAMA